MTRICKFFDITSKLIMNFLFNTTVNNETIKSSGDSKPALISRSLLRKIN
jgi:hypothetical protein